MLKPPSFLNRLLLLAAIQFAGLTLFAGSNSIREISDAETRADLRYYPNIIYLEPTVYGGEAHRHCPFEDLQILSKKINPSRLRDEFAAMGDLIEPLRHWKFSPECFEKDIHDVIKNGQNKIEGTTIGLLLDVGEPVDALVGVELSAVIIDDETLSVGLTIFEGAGVAVSLSPVNVGLLQGLILGSCPDGVFSYSGPFTNLGVGPYSWSYGDGDFPPKGNSLHACSAFMKMSGLAALSSGVSQTYYHLMTPLAYKVRGPEITKYIKWLNDGASNNTRKQNGKHSLYSDEH